MNAAARAALGYATRLTPPVAVFPTADDCHTPRCAHGCHDATTDPDIIAAWWRRWPTANLGIACGPVSGLLVIDIDCKGHDGFASVTRLEQANEPFPCTWQASTPSGGAHLYFRHPSNRALRNRVAFRPSVDVRAAGGSVAAPPSQRADGCYRWVNHPLRTAIANAPPWLLDVIDPPPPVRSPTPPIRVGSLDRLARYAAAAIDGECRELASMAPNTGRNMQLFKAAARLGEIVGAGLAPLGLVEDALEAAAHDCGLVREDGRHSVIASIKSGLNRGLANPREVAA